MIADLNQIQRFSKIFQLVMPGLDMKPLLEELRARIIEEVDYKYEAEAQIAYSAARDVNNRKHSQR